MGIQTSTLDKVLNTIKDNSGKSVDEIIPISLAEVAKILNLVEGTVVKSVRELREAGHWIITIKHGYPTGYFYPQIEQEHLLAEYITGRKLSLNESLKLMAFIWTSFAEQLNRKDLRDQARILTGFVTFMETSFPNEDY